MDPSVPRALWILTFQDASLTKKYFDFQAYLEHGDVDEEGFINENVEWVEYWRNLYPKVTIENIEKYKKKYQNSEEEKTDLLDAYKKHKVFFL